MDTTALSYLTLIFVVAFLANLSTVLWYCIDDTLAELVGVPELGRLPITFVLPAVYLISALFKGVSINDRSC